MMKRFLLALLLAAVPSLAFGQATVVQGGPWVIGHMPQYAVTGGSQPVIMDGGTAGGGGTGTNPAQIGLTARGSGTAPFTGSGGGPLGANFCMYDGPTTATAGYHYLCLDPHMTGGFGGLTFDAGGSASQLPFKFIINGTTSVFPDDFPIITKPYTSGGIPYFSSTTAIGNSALLGADELMLGGGAGVAPSTLGSKGTATTLLHGNASGAPTFGAVSLTADVSGTLPVASGGTGATTLTVHGVLLGQTTSAVAATTAGTSGQALVSGGASADPAFGITGVNGGGTGASSLTAHGVLLGQGTSAVAATGAGTTGQALVSGGASADAAFATLGVAGGGTGATTLTNHGVVLGQGTSAVAITSAGTSGQALISGGAGSDPAFGTVSVPGGGTGIASGTSGGIPYFASTTTIASSGALTANLPVIGGGAGVSPTVGSRSGNTTTFATASGSLTSGNCAKFDASGNIVDNGSACGSSGAITIGATTIGGGTDGRILFDNASVVGEKTVTGTGSVVLATSPTLVTPALGTPTALVLTSATGTPTSIGLANGTGLPLAGLAAQAADTFVANATNGSASPTAVALSASQLAGRGASGDIAAITLGTGLSMSGTTLSASGGPTLGTPQATTSGSAKTFTGISSAKTILISIKGMASNGSGGFSIQIGSGSLTTSGYVGASFYMDAVTPAPVLAFYSTTFNIIPASVTSVTYSGLLTLALENSSTNTWTISGSLSASAGPGDSSVRQVSISGYVPLSGALDRFAIQTANTFTAGEVNYQVQ